MSSKSKNSIVVPKSKTTQVAQIISKSINPMNLKIIEILQKKKEITYEELANELGIDPSNVGKRIRKMQNEGLLIRYKREKQIIVKWIGGVPALENELKNATNKHVAASSLAENYDLMILSPFSIFELLFEDNYWEIIMNLKVGITDDEIKTYLGNSINLDSIRRVLVTCDAHNIIKLNLIREPAQNDLIKIFEPLYRIESINKDFLDYLIIIRGLASAMSLRIEGKTNKEYSHLYDPLLDMVLPMYFSLREKAISNSNEINNEILKNVLLNYDRVSDMDRLYRPANWRKMLQQTHDIVIDEKFDTIMVAKGVSEEYKKSILGRVARK